MIQHETDTTAGAGVLPDDVQQCIRECNDCASECAQAAHHCLVQGGRHASAESQGLFRDCAHMCGLAAGFLSRSSRYATRACRMCAEVCGECAEECEPLAEADEVLRRCALACRRCEQSCEVVAGIAF